MLDFQLKQTSFRYGLAEDTDPHAVPFGVLTTLENFVWTKSAKVQKRLGVTALGNGIIGGGNIASGLKLLTRDNELCLLNGTDLYSYSSDLDQWRQVAHTPEASLTWDTLYDTPKGIKGSSIAINGGKLVHGWLTGSTTGTTAPLSVEVVDLETRAKLITSVRLNTASTSETVSVVSMGNAVFVIAKEGGTIRAYPVDLTTMTLRTPWSLAADARAVVFSNACDAVVIGGNRLVICYETATPALMFRSYSYNEATAAFTLVTSGAVAEPGNTITKLSIDGALGETIYVAYAVNSTLLTRCASVDATTLVAVGAPVTVTASTSVFVSVVRYNATNCMFLYTAGSTTTTRLVSKLSVVDANFKATPYAFPVSRPFMMNGSCYVYLAEYVSSAALSGFTGVSTVLVECSYSVDVTFPIHRYLGAVDIIIGGTWYTSGLSNVPIVGQSAYASLPFQADASPSGTNIRCGSRLAKASFTTEKVPAWGRSLSHSGETFFAGCGLGAYDGRTVFDYGFLSAPVIVSALLTPTAGTVDVGTHLYSVTQEQRGHTGLLHRSPAYPAASVVIAGASTVTLSLARYAIGNKQNTFTGWGETGTNETPVYFAFYRSVAAGSVPQRLTYAPAFNMLAVDPRAAAAPLTFVDSAPDANIGNSVTLASRPALYTAGGTLDDFQPPASVGLFLHVDRLWSLSGDRKAWWYSKSFLDDIGVAPGFHSSFRVVFDKEQTAGASMDEKAVFFSNDGISYMLGLGPAKNGSNSDFTAPIVIPSDIGCVNPLSVVTTPDGVVFESSRGIYILTRNLELVWLGRAIKDTLALFPNITSAVLVPKYNELRFTCNDEAGAFGVVIIYNMVEKQWSTAKYIQDGNGNGVAIADATVFQGKWTFLTTSGIVYTESSADSATAYLDAGAYVPGIVETAWISSAGPLAYHAVRNFWLTGSSSSDHNVTIDIAFNSTVAFQQTRTFPALSDVTTVGPLEELQIQVGKRRKCNSIKFRITDTNPLTVLGTVLGNGKGPSYETMGIEVGIMQGNSMSARKKG